MNMSQDKKKKGSVVGDTNPEMEFPYDYLSFAEMRNVIDLLTLYLSVNEQVIATKRKSAKFIRFHKIMNEIKHCLMKIKIDPWEQNIHNQQQNNSQTMSLKDMMSSSKSIDSMSVWEFFEHVGK